MKISSFHKQQGHLINFVLDKYHIDLAYDLYYILRENKLTPRAPSNLTDDKRNRLLGKTFRFERNYYDIDAVIAAVRPDYMLYPEKEKDSYYNANIVQFYHNGKLLNVKQPFINTKKSHKKTLVVDKEFWSVDQKNIETCLLELAEHKNIAFSAPIKLEILVKNQKIRKLFQNLKFSPGTIFKFQNNIGSEYEDVLPIFDFIEETRSLHNHIRFGRIPIRVMNKNHWESRDNAFDDLKRCLKIIDEAKKRKIEILMVSPERRRIETPFWYYFEIFEIWSIYFQELNYIEMMLHSATKRFKLPWYIILNDSLKWSLPNINFLVAVMNKFPETINKYGYRKWGDNFLNKELINFEEIKKYKGILKVEEEDFE
jgi:hypothetical protein